MKKTELENEIREIGFEVEAKELFFTVDGERRFRMTADNFLRLIDKEQLLELARKAEHPENDFEDLGVCEYVRTGRLLRKGLSLEQAAKAQGIPADRLRSFYSFGLQTFRESMSVQAERKKQADDEQDYCLSLPAPSDVPLRQGCEPSPSYAFLELNRIKQLQVQGCEPREIAAKMRLDRDDFDKWFSSNKHLLDIL